MCCIRPSPGRECIMDVVPRGAELEPLGIRWGVWGGCTHSAIITTTSLGSSSFIQTLSSPFSDALLTPTNSTTKQLLFHTLLHTWFARLTLSVTTQDLFTKKSINKYCELQKAYDQHNSAYHNPAEKEKNNVYQPHSNNIHQLYNRWSPVSSAVSSFGMPITL
jgi:hypothetical protein